MLFSNMTGLSCTLVYLINHIFLLSAIVIANLCIFNFFQITTTIFCCFFYENPFN